MNDVRQMWVDFLNPEVVKTKLVSAGLFMIAHETLIDSITRHPRGFFADRFTAKGPNQSEAYRREVLALDPRGKNDALRGSIAWLRSMGVIDEADEQAIKTATDLRNTLAHELMGLMAGTSTPDYILAYSPVFQLIEKIERWWAINVHLDLNRDELPDDADIADIVPGPVLSLRMLTEVALTDGDEAWEMLRILEANWKSQ